MSSPTLQSSLLRSLAASWLGLAVGVIISFFLSPFIVSHLGSAWYGVWAVASQFIGYLYLMDFGVRESVVRYTSKYAARRNVRALNRVLSVTILIYSGITLLALLATLVAVWGFPHWLSLEQQFWRDGRIALAFAGLTIAQTFFFNVFNGVLIGLKRWEISNVVGIALNMLRAALIVLFLRLGHGIVTIAAITCLVAMLGGVLNVFIARHLLKQAAMPFSFELQTRRSFKAVSRRVFGYGAYVIVNNVGEKLITATDALVVGIFLPISSVAYYAVASSLTGYLRALLGSSAQIFNPLASELHSLHQGSRLTAAFLLGVKICAVIAAPIVVTFIMLGKQFVGLWMGAEFAGPSSTVLSILSAAVFMAAPQYVFSSVLYGISRHRIIALLRLGEAVANLLLSVALVKLIGLAGVALGTAIPSAIAATVILPLLVGRVVGVTLPQFYLHAYVRPLLAVTPFALATLWVRFQFAPANLPGFFMRIALLMTIYLPCAYAVVLSKQERSLVRERIPFLKRTAV